MKLSLSIGILGQVWCLIVSIPDLCLLSYYVKMGFCPREFGFIASASNEGSVESAHNARAFAAQLLKVWMYMKTQSKIQISSPAEYVSMCLLETCAQIIVRQVPNLVNLSKRKDGIMLNYVYIINNIILNP